jgi:hypothetical protein
MKQMMHWVVVSVVVVLAALRPAAATAIVLNPPSETADGVLQDIGPDGVFDSAVTTTGVLVGTKTNVDSAGGAGPDPADLDLAITPSLVESLLSGGATHIGFLITPDRVLSLGIFDFFDASESTFPGILAPRLTVEYAIDSDNDGIPDNEDDCSDSDLSATVVIDGCDSEVPNTVFPSGCTIADLIAACAEGASNHGQFVSCVSHMTKDLKKAGTLTGQQKGAIQSCAAWGPSASTVKV